MAGVTNGLHPRTVSRRVVLRPCLASSAMGLIESENGRAAPRSNGRRAFAKSDTRAMPTADNPS